MSLTTNTESTPEQPSDSRTGGNSHPASPPLSETHRETPAIEVHDFSVAYRKRPVIWGIDFKIPPGHLVGVVGPNGAGKSTLLKGILGLVPPASGWVKIHGQSYKRQRKRVGYVPQRESVDWDFPTNAFDVVLMGRYGHLGLIRRPRAADKEIAWEALRKVGMADYATRQISQLSGGQQQRVFLARALAQNADVYFMDEPFAGVDAATESAILELLADLRSQGKTVVVVHHDLQTVSQYFDWVVLLNMRLIAHGPTEDVFTVDTLQKTYGGRLTILADTAHSVAQRTP